MSNYILLKWNVVTCEYIMLSKYFQSIKMTTSCLIELEFRGVRGETFFHVNEGNCYFLGTLRAMRVPVLCKLHQQDVRGVLTYGNMETSDTKQEFIFANQKLVSLSKNVRREQKLPFVSPSYHL